MTQKRAGFTLIELMIVVAIIAIIASIAIPRLMSARLAANESAAIATLRSISSAEAQLQSSGAIDSDADGGGEYGYFGELSGVAPLRISVAGVPAPGVVGTDELVPAVLSAAFGTLVVGQPFVTRSGYVFQIWLPGPTAGATPGLPEAVGVVGVGGGGAPGAGGFPNPNNSEVMWCAYAWPINAAQTGNRCFFMSQDGDAVQTLNRGAGAYTGIGGAGSVTPPFGAAYDSVGGANDMAQPLAIGPGAVANDANVWTVVN